MFKPEYLTTVCLTLSVGTASVECSLPQMKKNPIEESPGRINLSHLMKIAIESPQTLSEEELEQVVDVWNRQPRRRRTVV